MVRTIGCRQSLNVAPSDFGFLSYGSDAYSLRLKVGCCWKVQWSAQCDTRFMYASAPSGTVLVCEQMAGVLSAI